MDPAKNRIQRITYGLIIALIIGYLLYIGSNLIIPLVLGGFLALLLHPLYIRINRLIKIDWLGILLTFLLFLIPLTLVAYFFSSEIIQIIEDLPSIEDQLRSGASQLKSNVSKWLPFLKPYEIDEMMKNSGSLLNKPLSYIGKGLVSSTAGFISIILAFLYAFFFLLYRNKFNHFLQNKFSGDRKSHVDNTIQKIRDMIQSYVVGVGFVVLILCVLNSIGLYLIGIEYALLWGTLAGFLAVIPFIGTLIGGLLPFIFSLATSDYTWQPFAVVAYYIVIQQIEGNLITPKVVGDKVDINPLFSIIALIFFGQFWGIAGVFLAIPMIAILKIIFDQFESTRPYSILLEAKRNH